MRHVLIVGGGPAGLMAADVIAAAGVHVTVCDRMPSLGRKLLMAGRGGLNLTHSEDLEALLTRYGAARSWLEPHIRAFPPADLITFANALGQETFVGSSGRVFPRSMKASPLLRAWLQRLGAAGVAFRPRHLWLGSHADGGALLADVDGRELVVATDAQVLAMGGASWSRLGSDGGWVATLESWGIEITPLAPTNCGIAIAWSTHVRDRFAGTPLKRIAIAIGDEATVRGEAVITARGLEGGAVYALSPAIRARIGDRQQTPVTLRMDLRPDMTAEQVAARLAKPAGKQSLANWLRKTLSLTPAEMALMREAAGKALPTEASGLAALVKSLPLPVSGLAPIDRAISTAGGIVASELGPDLQLRKRPGIFAAGEMLDWEAPTGGYLLQACFATGLAAGKGVLAHLGIPTVAPLAAATG